MSTRAPRRSPETIGGYHLSWPEFHALNAVQDYMRKNAGDSQWSNSTQPAGDGREVPLREIFPDRNITANARRAAVRRLAVRNVLRVCGIEFNPETGMLKGVRR